jgi:methionyl-tRNA formyltransferase
VPPLRLIFFGTPEIAVPTLERLIAGPHEVVGVISQPDRARGRGRKESPSPVSTVALRENIPLVRPERIGETEAVEQLRALRPDLGIVVAFGQFLPKKTRELPSRGYLINAHASLLPRYRGASPIARAILDGESETGMSIMRVEREMDAGPVALVMRTPIEPRENTAELSNRLAEIAATAIAQCVDRIAGEEIEWTPQDVSHATFAPKLEKSDAVLDLRESAQALACRIHALSPKPGGALTVVAGGAGEASGGSSDETVLKLSRADSMPFESPDTSTGDASHPTPGTIERDVDGAVLRIATGDGWLVPLVIQRAGGKPLPIADFLRGFELIADARFALPDLAGETTQ